MKKIYFFATALLLSTGLIAQTNLGFETWASGNPTGWDTDNGFMALVDGAGGTATIGGVDVVKSTTEGTGDAAEGTSYAKLQTWSLAGVAAYGAPDGFYPGQAEQTIATTTKFESIKFSYRATLVGGDAAVAFVTASGPGHDFGQNAIGQGLLLIKENEAGWTEVTVPITWYEESPIDSIRILFASSANGVFGAGLSPAPTADGTLFEIDNVRMFDGLASVKNLTFNSVNVYPNPAVNTVTFDVKGLDNGTISINSITGQEVVNTTISNGAKTVDVSNLNNGVYIYAIRNMNGEIIKTNKLVIRK